MTKGTKKSAQEPQKDNTLTIVLISVGIFVGLPIIGAIVIFAIGFNVVRLTINEEIAKQENRISVENPNGKYIYSEESEILEKIYDTTVKLDRRQETNPSIKSNISRGECEEIEDYITDELGRGIKICDDSAFRSYAYIGGTARIVELYGVSFDSGKYVKIAMNSGFDEYYQISIEDADDGNVGLSKLIRYGYSENLPINDSPEDEINEPADEGGVQELENDEGMELNRA